MHIRRRKPNAWPHEVWSLCFALGLLLLSGPVAWAQNRVLELDGNGSYVVLPPNIFTNLTEATVEVWTKWDSFPYYSRIFEFGAANQSMMLFNHSTTRDLRFSIYPEYAQSLLPAQPFIRVNDLLRTNEWIHLAAISGGGGMKLYANGVLVGEHANSASFADMKISQTNLFGRGLFRNPTDQDFHGQIDELRVWNHRRTEAQIRGNIFKNLNGTEPGLAGLWNFNDGTAKDSSTNGHHGTPRGNATVAKSRRPTSGQFNLPRVLSGKVTDATGNPVMNATVRALRQDQVISTAPSRPDGSYTIVVRTEHDTFDIEASAGDLGVWVMGVICPRGERKEVNLTLSNAVSLAGKVTAFDGSPIPDVIVQVLRADAPPRESGKLTTPGLVATTTTTNGTPSNRINDLHFAPDGTLWLATQNGVSRFDGLKFSKFSEREGLIDNRVFCIHTEKGGLLWFGTEKGVSRFDSATGRFQKGFPSGTNGLTGGRVFDILGALLALTETDSKKSIPSCHAV